MARVHFNVNIVGGDLGEERFQVIHFFANDDSVFFRLKDDWNSFGESGFLGHPLGYPDP
jgi:hypothetical protein